MLSGPTLGAKIYLGLKDRCLSKKVGISLGMEMTPPPNYCNFKIKGLSGKNMGK